MADPQRAPVAWRLRSCATKVGYAASEKVREKEREWAPALDGLLPKPDFFAAVVETFGGWSVPMRRFLALCARRIAERQMDATGGREPAIGSVPAYETSLGVRMAVVLQRAQAMALVGAAVFGAILLFIFIGPLLWKTDPAYANLLMRNKAPSAQFPFGTDELGRDLLARLMAGGKVSIAVGLTASCSCCCRRLIACI